MVIPDALNRTLLELKPSSEGYEAAAMGSQSNLIGIETPLEYGALDFFIALNRTLLELKHGQSALTTTHQRLSIEPYWN